MEMTGAQIAIEELKAGGVEIAFGIPGGAIMPFYDDLLKANFKHILTRHEQGAAHMADGYARVSGKVAVVVATSGPGATNLITGLLTAQMDSVPLIAVTGQVATPMIGTDAFQEADIYGCSIPVTKYNWLVKDARQIQGVIREAIRVATTGRPGPVLVDIPKDIQTARTDYNPQAPAKGALPAVRQMPEADAKAIEKLMEALEQAERPVILAGAGIIKAGAAAELARFARHAKIPVINTLLGMGGFPGTDPLFLGMPGMHGTAYANHAIMESDLIIAVGARFEGQPFLGLGVAGAVGSHHLVAKRRQLDADRLAEAAHSSGNQCNS